MVHGYQGISCDMRLLKNVMEQQHPEIEILLCISNELDRNIGLEEQGVQLAMEVDFILDDMEKTYNLTDMRVSFMGFSMGGLIIRAAIPHLQQKYHQCFYNFISLSTPHLGCQYRANRLIDTGMWIIGKLSQSRCLSQMSMRDSPEITKTYLYKLSENKSLNYFHHVILIGSFQDTYIPFYSARVQCSKSDQQQEYFLMAQNILDNPNRIQQQRVFRVDINLVIEQKNFDSLIGKAAHIELIQNPFYMNSLFTNYGYLFK